MRNRFEGEEELGASRTRIEMLRSEGVGVLPSNEGWVICESFRRFYSSGFADARHRDIFDLPH